MAKILFVVPSEEIKQTVADTIREHRHYYSYLYPKRDYIDVDITVRTSVDLIDYQECNADVIIARGLLASRLKQLNPSIPVVESPVTSTDLMLAVKELQGRGMGKGPVALIGLGMVLYQAKAVEELLKIKMVSMDYLHQPESPDVVQELIDTAVAKGFRYFIGGATMVRMTTARGYDAGFVNSCPESMWLALTEAQHIAAIRRKERERSARYETILNHSLEGIITTDADKMIIQMNSAAGNILGIDPAGVAGSRVEKLIPESKFMALLGNERDYANEIIKLGKNSIVLNKVAASLGKEVIGNVITFQDVSNVQSTEIKIRSALHRRGLLARYTFGDIIGESDSLKSAIETAKTFASVPSNVLLIGETGTGKELFAQSMHNAGLRKDAPFVAVNCAAIPENLMESEFFGYAQGAFTGASKEGRMGFFELAHGGTLFLDEVSEIPLNLQSKLLRVIQEGEVMRLGHDKIIPVDVRVICASNRDLKPLVREGGFREDLYYRLAVLQLRLPALRDRQRDIGLLADFFVRKYSSLFTSKPKTLTDGARDLLCAGHWEGNIRELRNVCEQLVVLSRSETIGSEDVRAAVCPDDPCPEASSPATEAGRNNDLLKQTERELIVSLLGAHGFNRSVVARQLGIDRSTLWRKMKKYGISYPVLV